MKKFELTTNTRIKCGRTLIQIRAAISFGNVKKGDLGGWIEKESSIGDDVWLFSDVEGFANAKFNAGEFWGGEFWGGEFWGGEFWAGVFRGGVFRGGVFRGGEFNAGVFRGGEFRGGEFRGGVFWGGEFWGGVFRGGEFRGGVFRGGEFRGGVFKNSKDYIAFCSIGSRNGVLTAYIVDKNIEVNTGCFKGNLTKFKKTVKSKHKNNEFAKEYEIAISLIKLRFDATIKLLNKKK